MHSAIILTVPSLVVLLRFCRDFGRWPGVFWRGVSGTAGRCGGRRGRPSSSVRSISSQSSCTTFQARKVKWSSSRQRAASRHLQFESDFGENPRPAHQSLIVSPQASDPRTSARHSPELRLTGTGGPAVCSLSISVSPYRKRRISEAGHSTVPDRGRSAFALI